MTTVDEAREALQSSSVTDATARQVIDAIDAFEAAVRAEYLDPQDRWRLVRVGTEFLSQFGTRTEDGARLTAEWREPDAAGIYEPVFTRHEDDNPIRESAETLAALREAAEAVANESPRNRAFIEKWQRLRAALVATPAEEER